MKIPADEIIALLSSARNSALIVAPFVRSESLSRLLDSVAANIETVVVTRWRPADLIAGVSDLDIYDLAKKRPVQLYLRNDLHAKLFAADDKCLVGSVNVTHTALGWRNPSNLELLTPVARTASHIVEFENTLLAGAVRATAALRDRLVELLESLSVLPVVASKEQNEGITVGLPPPSWIPRIRNPDELYAVYRGNSDVGRSAFQTMQEEITHLGTVPGMDEEGFRAWVAATIIQTPLVVGVIEHIEQEGQLTEDGLSDLLVKIGANIEEYRPRNALEVLERWLTYFLPAQYETARDSIKLIKARKV